MAPKKEGDSDPPDFGCLVCCPPWKRRKEYHEQIVGNMCFGANSFHTKYRLHFQGGQTPAWEYFSEPPFPGKFGEADHSGGRSCLLSKRISYIPCSFRATIHLASKSGLWMIWAMAARTLARLIRDLRQNGLNPPSRVFVAAGLALGLVRAYEHTPNAARRRSSQPRDRPHVSTVRWAPPTRQNAQTWRKIHQSLCVW